MLILDKIEYEMTKYNNTNTKSCACLFFPQYMVEYMDKETLYPIRTIKFEDTFFPCPNDLHKYLKNHYGDYNLLPPIEERIGHKPYIVEI